VIVVGVDGSEGGAAALAFAAEEAVLRKAQLRIVSAWEVPVMVSGAAFAAPVDTVTPDPATIEAFRDRAQQIADEAAATAKTLQPSLDVDVSAAMGHPADVLLAQGVDAAMIVVGRRGLGGLKSLRLGSVSQQVVQHATCPVVVVQHSADS
jgi:nucleotide-binding universal stress UspA family protein